ncbi:MAG: DUF5069 domain-containing protein [Candidatus Eremiobacteraeota bacterium]|nr:DUF5069 domain-containing protein [Candidatus Eremiobacteraeota bacterium]
MNGIPRRWSAQIDGIRWLPRLMDKAKMSANGALGPYLMGNSPVDKALMKRMNVTTEEFVRIATASPTDAEALARFRARPGYDEARVQRWSANFERTYAALIRLWDIDEGYAPPNLAERVALGAYRRVEGAVSALIRKLSPAP